MNEILDRVLGFLPQRGIIWIGLGLFIFLMILQRLNDWLKKQIRPAWMEEEKLQQRNALEQDETK